MAPVRRGRCPPLPSVTGQALGAFPATSACTHAAATCGRDKPRGLLAGPHPRPGRLSHDATVPAATGPRAAQSPNRAKQIAGGHHITPF